MAICELVRIPFMIWWTRVGAICLTALLDHDQGHILCILMSSDFASHLFGKMRVRSQDWCIYVAELRIDKLLEALVLERMVQ